MPIPWLMGAMCVNVVAALAGLRVALPSPLVAAMIAVLGVMSGGSFTPDTLDRAVDWWRSILTVLGFVTVMVTLLYVLFRKGLRYPMVTAFFCSTPGGFTAMTIIGHAMGGDIRTISLIQSMRVISTIMVVPVWFALTQGYDPHAAAAVDWAAGMSPVDGAILIGCGVGGIWLGRKLKLGGGALLGPLIVSVIVHLAGLTDAGPPESLVAVAQVVLGANVGARFVDTPVRRVVGTMGLGLLVSFAILAAAIVVAYAMQGPVGVPLASLMLALAPGGFPIMVLISLALDLDTAFVTSHHVLRMAFVVLVGPMVIRWMARRNSGQAVTPAGAPGDPPPPPG